MLDQVSFFSNNNYIVIVRYAKRDEKRRRVAVSPTWSYDERQYADT